MKIRISTVVIAVAVLGPTLAAAQSDRNVEVEKAKKAAVAGLFGGWEKQLLDIAPIAPSVGVRNVPFTAEAVTEFTQTLGDGNRIERRYTSSIARDSAGRTRREQEVAMLGPLAALQEPRPRLVVISDPATGTEYTLDERFKLARLQSGLIQIRSKVVADPANKKLPPAWIGRAEGAKAWIVAGPGKVTTEPLGTRQIEGVAAEGTRTTMTIAEGTIGNVRPIDVVTERWFSRDLQMEVLISRRDPRSGDTEYRLTDIVRAEPPADLFVIPAGYAIESDGPFTKKLVERDKMKGAVRK